jgi:ABC-type uncharacterized transport system substrate-binding protein
MPRRWLKLILHFVLALSGLLWNAAYGAERAEVAVALVIDKAHPVYSELIDGLQHHLEQGTDTGLHISIITLSDAPAAKLLNVSKNLPDLIVTVGTTAAQQVSELGLSVPVLSVLIPKVSFEQIKQQAADNGARPRSSSAIYLDQPLERRLDLIRLVLPKARRVGVLLGPHTGKFEPDLIAAAEARKFQIHIRHITETDNLVAALEPVLKTSDVMLGVVDPFVFNAGNTQNILLTAYRHRVPLIGVSPAYVKAGALAAVYSTPEQIGHQLAEILGPLTSRPEMKLPEPQYPKYFSVAANQRVARSLGIDLDDEESLARKLTMQK